MNPNQSLIPNRMKEERDRPFMSLQRQMESMMDRFFSEHLPMQYDSATFSPKLELSEDDKDVTITAEIPGMDLKDVEVSLKENELTIKGEKKAFKEEKQKTFYRSERSYGAFQRRIGVAPDAYRRRFRSHPKSNARRLDAVS